LITLLFPILTAVTPLYKHGAYIYETNCQVCHGNPSEGAFGPPIFGSSKELITARILYGGYPPGYNPKRNTNYMPQFPTLEKDIPAITAYLNGVK
jgi:mono/diheme cytochrome c family protein